MKKIDVKQLNKTQRIQDIKDTLEFWAVIFGFIALVSFIEWL
jgi:hypothetical protein